MPKFSKIEEKILRKVKKQYPKYPIERQKRISWTIIRRIKKK